MNSYRFVLAITEIRAITKTATAAIKIMLGLPPIHLFIMTQVQKANYMLQPSGLWKNSLLGNARIVGTIGQCRWGLIR